MNQRITHGIILNRRDFGEADRIITLLTPDHGKLTLMAKGVRRVKSKLAGGIELFSVSEITFVKGRGEVGTLVSTRLVKHYGEIVKDLDRTMLGYDLIKKVAKATEEVPEEAYFSVLTVTFEALNDANTPPLLIHLWLLMQLLRLGGATPNLQSDSKGKKLEATKTYRFSFDDATFVPDPNGTFGANHIKLLRLGFDGHVPAVLKQIQGIGQLLHDVQGIITTMAAGHLRQ